MQVADVDVSALTTPRLTFDYFHYSQLLFQMTSVGMGWHIDDMDNYIIK